MDAIMIIIMLVLFILALIFVFSTALLTPYIGKKNLLSVILLGLVVGLVGGAFLVAPVVNDLPDFTRTLVEDTVSGTDVINVQLSTNHNITETIHNISSINGVHSITYDGILMKTDTFETPADQSKFFKYLNNTNTNITGIDSMGDNTFFIHINKDGDPQQVLDDIYGSFANNTYIHLRYTSMDAQITVDAKNITKIKNSLSPDEVIIKNITGPTEDTTNAITSWIPDQNGVIIGSAILGMVVGLLGFFIDTVFNGVSRFRKTTKHKTTKREKIQRRTVPGTGNFNKDDNKKYKKRKSFDVFKESDDNLEKDDIGSRKSNDIFEETTPKETSSKEVLHKPKQSKNKSKISFNPFKRSSGNKEKTEKVKKSNKRNTEKEVKRSKSEHKNSGKRRLRPKRKD